MKNENLIDSGECGIIGKISMRSGEGDGSGITNGKGNPNQKYDVNLNSFFDKSSEEFAYFLGFFYADGYNNVKQGKVVITLKSPDAEILEKFSNLFFGGRPLYRYRVKCQTNICNSVSSLMIGNRELSNLLASYGAYQNKTFKIRFPVWLNKNLWKHFIRGYFDGDGSIEKHGRTYRLSIASNLEFNTSLQKIILKHTGLNFGIIPQGKITVLYKGGNRVTKTFLDWLYKDATIFLLRKHNRYQELLTEINRVDTKYTHVYYNKSDKKWISRLPNKFGRKYLGSFNTREEAESAYLRHFPSFSSHTWSIRPHSRACHASK